MKIEETGSHARNRIGAWTNTLETSVGATRRFFAPDFPWPLDPLRRRYAHPAHQFLPRELWHQKSLACESSCRQGAVPRSASLYLSHSFLFPQSLPSSISLLASYWATIGQIHPQSATLPWPVLAALPPALACQAATIRHARASRREPRSHYPPTSLVVAPAGLPPTEHPAWLGRGAASRLSVQRRLVTSIELQLLASRADRSACPPSIACSVNWIWRKQELLLQR